MSTTPVHQHLEEMPPFSLSEKVEAEGEILEYSHVKESILS